jgi:hypothetical protein
MENGDLSLIPENENIFRNDGASWTIRFQGELMATPDWEGLHYIATVIEASGCVLSAEQLRASQSKRKVLPESIRARPSVHDAIATESIQVETARSDKVLDRRTIQDGQQELLEMDAAIENAKNLGDVSACDRLQREKEKLIDELLKGCTPTGQLKELASRHKRARDAVTNAINRAVKKLRTRLPALADHLAMRLDMKDGFKYVSDPTISWILH